MYDGRMKTNNYECYCVINSYICISKKLLLSHSWCLFCTINEQIEEPEFIIQYEPGAPYFHQVQHLEASFKGRLFMIAGRSIMLISDDMRKCDLIVKDSNESCNSLLIQMFYTHAVQRHMLQFHSSLISHQNSGIMFLGPSGIGKTTQAELWNQYRDALIINGDIVFVQETEKNFLGWGTPWHGSSPYCENTSVPLRAMVVLKQAKENSIRELVGFEKVSEVSNHVFYPQWLENGMELCLETLDHLLTAIPVYELSCRPDEDAVRLTEETIFGT